MTDGNTAPIVVGVDGSEVGAAALDWAAGEAARRDCALEAVTVSRGADRESDAVASQVEAVVARHPSVHVRHLRLVGAPAPALVRVARGAAMLVVGSHGAGRLAQVLLGSVSAYCATHAACPVVIVPGCDDAADHGSASDVDPLTTPGPLL